MGEISRPIKKRMENMSPSSSLPRTRRKCDKQKGKWWGDRSVQPILAIHGLLDNCATFDELLPHLEVPSALAIDLPGHGLSSHVAPGLPNDFSYILLCLRYLIKYHFKWPHVDFLGHSFGSCSAFSYCGLFPKNVRKLVSLDCARFNMAARSDPRPEFLHFAAQNTLDADDCKPVELSYDEHLQNFMELRRSKGAGLTEKSSRILLSRNLQKTGENKFVETVDPRLPLYLGILPLCTLDEMAQRNITCHMLSIRFTDGVLKGSRKTAYDNQLAAIRKISPNLVSLDVTGNHHAHLEDPECVASLINNVLVET